MSGNSLVLYLVEFLTGYLMQAVAFVLFVYAFNGKKIEPVRYIVSCAIMTASVFIIRNMNINFGVHTIINLILLIAIMTFYCRMPIIKCTIASLLVTLVMIVIELINIAVMMAIFTPEIFKVKVKDPMWNAITAIPATTGLLIVALIVYFVRTRRKPQNDKASE